MDILSKLADNLKFLMAEREITTLQLAAKTGIDGSAIARFLRAERLPNLHSLVALADFFGCSTDCLLGLEEASSSVEFKRCPPFSERISELLKKFGKSKYRIKKDTNIDELTVSAWQSGKYLPNAESLVKLAAYFDCTVDFLIGRV